MVTAAAKRISALFVVLVLVAAGVLAAGKGGAMERKLPSGEAPVMVKLPPPRLDGAMSVERALLTRRSVRGYRDEPLTLAEAGQLLWAAQGITSSRGLRAAPSAGALYPLEVYLVAGRVDGIAPGIYRYRPAGHILERVVSGDRREDLCRAAFGQSPPENAPASLVFTAVYGRTTRKYGERGLRYVYMDHGHAAENVYLQAVSLGLGTVLIGAFDDEAVKRFLSLPAGEEPLSIMPVGRLGGQGRGR